MAESSELLVVRLSLGRGDSSCANLGLGDLALVEGLSLSFALLLEAFDDILVSPSVFVR